MKIDWVKIGSYIVIIILSFMLLKSCNKEPEVVYKDRIKVLTKTVKFLEKQKQEIKTKIVYVQKEAEKQAEKVIRYTNYEISDYYGKRYDYELELAEGGVIMPDTIAKRNIVELIQRDGCFKELKLTNDVLKIEETKGIFKDSIISNLNDTVILQEKTIRKEKNKKTFWQVLSMLLVTGSVYAIAK